MILAGDIGGTKTRLATFVDTDQGLQLKSVQTFASREFPGLLEILQVFQHGDRIEGACFGIAGPVKNGRCATTNLPWIVDTHDLTGPLGLKSVGLINDLEAHAHGIAALPPEDLQVLQAGEPDAVGNRALIAAGTGLGEAGLYWDGQAHHPFASEGGHSDFAPTDALQIELLRYLQTRFGRVSWERILSGAGIYNLYQFVRDQNPAAESPEIAEQIAHLDPPAVITSAARAESCVLCVQALDLFVRIYGAEAGNMALKVLATGGVYIGGGIAPKIITALQKPLFMEAFTDKGRLSSLLEAMPVRVILNDRTALFGAAQVALQLA